MLLVLSKSCVKKFNDHLMLGERASEREREREKRETERTQREEEAFRKGGSNL